MAEDLAPALERAQRRLRGARPGPSDVVVAAFLAERREATRSAYRRDIEAFRKELRRDGVDLLDARPDDVIAHVVALCRTGARPATIRRRLSVISGLYRHARELRLTSADPLAGVPRPPDPARGAPSSASSDGMVAPAVDVGALVRATSLSSRDRVLILLLAEAGLRLVEVLTLDVGDVLSGRDGVLLRVRCARRGGRELILPTACGTACRGLTRGRRDGPLLITAGGRRLDRHHARRVVARAAARAGLGERVTPRILREAFIGRALAGGVDKGTLAAAAGLGDPRSLCRYGQGVGLGHVGGPMAVRLADPA